MKKALFIAIQLSMNLYAFSQSHPASSPHALRAGDVISKQQVEYKDPGRSGKDVLWDFSQLDPVNPQYQLSYITPVLSDSGYVMGKRVIPVNSLSETDSLFIGKEHGTSYFYCLQSDTLFCLGHENAVVSLWYDCPLLMDVYSSAFQEQTTLPFRGKGLYSMQVPVRTQGTMTIEQDATGMILLPTGDTLKHVSRVKTLQRIVRLDKGGDDSVSLVRPIEMETYRWYAKGYRYPVFETVCSYNFSDEAGRNANFTTAFFYPPEEAQHNEEYEVDNEISGDGDTDPWEGLTYNVYPNPVNTSVEVEIYLPIEADVTALLTSPLGVPVQKKQYPTQEKGIFRFQLNLTGYTTGNYVLDIWLNEHLISHKIMKL
jgi:hypothetical protein